MRLGFFAPRTARTNRATRRTQSRRSARKTFFSPLHFEELEARHLLAADDVISVGRFQSAYSTLDVQNHELKVTYTVFNQQADEVTGVLLSTLLEPGVVVKSASQSPDQNGQAVSWSLGAIEPFGSASIDLIVTLPTIIPLQIDGGAEAFGTVNAGIVSDEAPAARLRNAPIDAALLASTPDANTLDPFVRAKAAQLDHDPQQIFDFLKNDIGYESYVGSLRGARGTLWSGAGNSLDEASLGVALMRASGIPAKYAEGTLPLVTAQDLILSMFDDPQYVTGLVLDGAEKSDPVNDPELLAETTNHYWMQADLGSGMESYDGSLESSMIGDNLAPISTNFLVVPNELQHRIELRLVAEFYNAATSLFGGFVDPLSRTEVLNKSFSTAELVGRPLGFSQFVSRSGFGAVFSSITNNYSPYIEIGDVAEVGASEVFTGTAFQETLTNFPFGSQVLTGLFLNVKVTSPGGAIENLEKTLVDRLGQDVRSHGGRPNLTFDATSGPALYDTDVFTLDVASSVVDVTRQLALLPPHLSALRLEIDALQEADGRFPVAAFGAIREYYRDLTRLANARFFDSSEITISRLAELAFVKAYPSSPRLIFSSFKSDVGQESSVKPASLILDLRKDDLRVVAMPGQAKEAEKVFRFTFGVGENVSERNTVALFVEANNVEVVKNTVTVFERAAIEDVPLRYLSTASLMSLENDVEASPEALDRISTALSRGLLVIVPARPVQIDGDFVTAWYEYDPETGETIGVTEDGSHGGIVEHAATIIIYSFAIGFISQAIILNQPPDVRTPWKNNVNNTVEVVAGAGAGIAGAGKHVEIIGVIAAAFAVFKAGQALANIIFQTFDPPIGNMLFNANPIVEFPPPTIVGVRSKIVSDPVFTVPFQGAQLPTAFRIGISNDTAVDSEFDLTVLAAPPGFELRTSAPRIFVPAGASGEVGIYLFPTGAGVPPVGTVLDFSLRAISAATSQSVDASFQFVVPEIQAAAITPTPAILSPIPGATEQVQFEIKNVGNVPLTINFSTSADPQLSLSSIGSLTLQPGASGQRTVVVEVSSAVALNSDFRARIFADYGGTEPIELLIPVHVAAPGVESIHKAASDLANLGNDELAARLQNLAVALTSLTQEPDSLIFKGQAIASLDAIIGLLRVDPILVNFGDDLTPPRDELVAAQTATEIQSALDHLGDELDGFADAASRLSDGNFEVFLTPSSQVAQPGTPTQFEIKLHNIGFSTSTYDISLGALPPGVTGDLSASSVTLSPDQFSQSLFVTITPPTNELNPFDFEIQISLNGSPDLVKTLHGALTVRNEFLSVVEVASNPLFVNPGETTQISTRLFNAVNRSQEVLVSYVLKDSGGATVFTSSKTQAALNTQSSLLHVDLDSFNTTGLANGQYTIEATITKLDGSPIPGGTGTGTLFIGAPVTSTIIVSPPELAQGTSNITTTLTIDSQVPLDNPLNVISQTVVSGASDVNRFGDFVYVATSSGIQVYNVAGANINAPVFVRTVGSTANFIETKGDRLYVVSGFNTKLSIYSLADPSNPALLGETTTLPYNAADSMVITDTHVYISAIQFIFFLGNHDIFDHNGALLSIDISNPAAPVLDGVLFNENGTNNDGIKSIGGIDQFGGNRNVWSVKQVTPTLLYLAGSTATGTNTQTGSGIISVIDISNPLSLTVVREVTIPGTVQVLGLSIEGDTAFVTGTSGGWNDFAQDFGFTGNVVLATLDISTPNDPQVTHTETLSRASRGISAENTSPGGGVYAYSSLGTTSDQPALFVTDVSNPSIPLVTSIDVPTEIRRHFSLGGFIYTVSPSGLIIYQVDPIEAIQTTASVQIPNNNGITPIPASFSTPPTQIIPGANFDTYVWDTMLVSGIASRKITWESEVANIAPGEIRNATLVTTVDYDFLGSPEHILLPPQEVVGKQILSLSPGSYTIQPGDSAFFLLTLQNPTLVDRNFEITVQGVPSEWVEVFTPVFVFGGSTAFASLVIHTDPFAPQATYSFTVTATSEGVIGSVGGEVTLLGDPLLSNADPHSHGVVAELIPTSVSTGQGGTANYVVRLTNTGSANEIFSFSAFDIPPGFTAVFSEDFVEVPPGASNYRDVLFSLTAPPNIAPGAYPFTVVADSGTTLSGRADLPGTVNVLNLGVSAQFQPQSGPPNATYQLLVKNTGQVSETFDLSLSGPGALVATLGVASVTLAPGASQLVSVTIGQIDFAFPGELSLVAAAKARSNAAVLDIDPFSIAIPGSKEMDAAFDQDVIANPQPGPITALLLVDNLGNLEDEYVVEITSITGPLSASLTGLDGLPTQSIPVFRLPGLTGGAFQLQALLNSLGSGTITVQVRSLTDDSIIAVDTLEIGGGQGNQPPVITSGGGGETASASISENATVAYDTNSTDPDVPVQPRTYSLGGGADANRFSIDVNSGILIFKTAPNFEIPTDQNQNNVYEVIVRVTDGFLFDAQTVFVTVTNVNEAPRITSGGGGDAASVNISENTLFAYDANSTDVDLPAQARTYSIAGGADSALFNIDSLSGILSFKSSPNFENPLDQGKNNVYDVTIRVTDGSLFDTQSVAVHVVDVNEAPTMTNYGGAESVSRSIPENSVVAADANSSDPDLPAQIRSYSISGGLDAAWFSVDAMTGVVQFKSPPDFENPQDVGANNVYNVIIRVTDGELFDTQAFAITVTNLVNETIGYLAVGADAGASSQPLVKVYRPDGSLLEQFLAYEANYQGGVRVATGDVTGDGIIDVITAPGRGHNPIIKVFDGALIADGIVGNARDLPSFIIQAFPETFGEGLYIAAGDVVGDGLIDIVAIPERGKTEVRIFRNRLNDSPHPHPGDAFSNTPWRTFTAFEANFIGGGTIAVGDVDRSRAKSEVIVGSGSGMTATVKAYNVNGSPQLVNTYYPIDQNFRGGIFVAAGDVNGDGIADIIAGAGQGGSSKVAVLNGKNGASLGAFYPYTDVSKQAPVRVLAKDLNGDGIVDAIYAGHGADGKTKTIRRYNPSSKTTVDFLFENDPALGGGYYLG